MEVIEVRYCDYENWLVYTVLTPQGVISSQTVPDYELTGD